MNTWMTMTTGVTLTAWILTATVAGVWHWICRPQLFVMLAYEKALQRLEALESRAEHQQVPAIRDAVIHVLAEYLHVQLQLPETGSDRRAALDTLAQSTSRLDAYQRSLLEAVLSSDEKRLRQDAFHRAQLFKTATQLVLATALRRRRLGWDRARGLGEQASGG